MKKMKKLAVFPGDPIIKYYEKGEIKPRYWNPGEIFDRVDIFSFADREVEPQLVQDLVGRAELHIHPIGSFQKALAGLPYYLRRARRLVERIGPDMIRGHGAHIAAFYATYIGSKLGIPAAISLHGDYEEIRSYPGVVPWTSYVKNYVASRLFEGYALSHADTVICVTGFIEGYARKYGAREIEIIYNRVSTRKFVFGEPASGALSPLEILCIGRVNKQKNQECLLEAARELDARIRFIGKDSEEYLQYLKEKVVQFGMQDRVEFIPAVSYGEIERYYQEADIFAIATQFEGFCIPVLEAMASGLPVVVSRIPPLVEIVGDAGLLVDIAPENYRDAFEKLARDAALRKKLGEKARRRAEGFDAEIMEDKEKELYLRLMEKRVTRR